MFSRSGLSSARRPLLDRPMRREQSVVREVRRINAADPDRLDRGLPSAHLVRVRVRLRVRLRVRVRVRGSLTGAFQPRTTSAATAVPPRTERRKASITSLALLSRSDACTLIGRC
eukprot:scaffold32915_cov61-Phaeocystis_antarctica.AAC.2